MSYQRFLHGQIEGRGGRRGRVPELYGQSSGVEVQILYSNVQGEIGGYKGKANWGGI